MLAFSLLEQGQLWGLLLGAAEVFKTELRGSTVETESSLRKLEAL